MKRLCIAASIIVGPVNIPLRAPYHASQMYATNVVNLLKLMVSKEGVLTIDQNDEVIRETLVTHGGKVVHSRVGQHWWKREW